MKETQDVYSIICLTAVMVAVVLIDVRFSAGADLPASDNPSSTTTSEAKTQKPGADSSASDAPAPENKSSNKKLAPTKKEKQKKNASTIQYGYTPQRSSDRSNYRNAIKIERDLGQNMRSIDNAIRQMNTDINRIRTIERRF